MGVTAGAGEGIFCKNPPFRYRNGCAIIDLYAETGAGASPRRTDRQDADPPHRRVGKGRRVLYNLPAIVVANGLGAALTLLLVVSNRRNMRNSFFDDQLFFSMCLMGMFMCVLETASYFVDGAAFPGARSLSVTVNAILFMGSALCAFLWAAYVECKLFGRVPGLLSYTALPALAVCLMAALNLFFPVFFSVSPDNVYQRQPLAAASYLVVYGYLLWGAWQVFRYRRKAGRYLFMPVMVFLAPIFIGSLIQFFCYGMSLIWVSVAFGLTSLYINIQNETFMLDALTKLYNREYLTRYLRYLTQHMAPQDRFSGIMIDINSFKAINDTYGHSVGDDALQAVGRVLSEAVTGKDVAARYGGDEFVVITMGDGAAASALMERIQARTALLNQGDRRPYAITLSMGLAVYDPGADTLDTFLRRMDKRMYEEKRRHYADGNHDRRRRSDRRGPAGEGEQT